MRRSFCHLAVRAFRGRWCVQLESGGEGRNRPNVTESPSRHQCWLIGSASETNSRWVCLITHYVNILQHVSNPPQPSLIKHVQRVKRVRSPSLQHMSPWATFLRFLNKAPRPLKPWGRSLLDGINWSHQTNNQTEEWHFHTGFSFQNWAVVSWLWLQCGTKGEDPRRPNTTC